MFARIVRIALPLLILAAGIGGMAALVKSKPEREPLGAEERAWTVATAAVEPGTATPQLVLFALVDSPRTTHLSSAVTADVDAVDVLEGQRVEFDDRLLALDDREILDQFPRARFIAAHDSLYAPILETGTAIGIFEE